METRKEDRRVRRTKKLLTQALTQLLQRKQVNEITVRELTDLADMNRGTFYLYYKDISDMLEKIEDELFENLDTIIALRENADVSEHYCYSYIIFGCAGIIRAWVNRGCPESSVEMADLTGRLILSGSLS